MVYVELYYVLFCYVFLYDIVLSIRNCLNCIFIMTIMLSTSVGFINLHDGTYTVTSS